MKTKKRKHFTPRKALRVAAISLAVLGISALAFALHGHDVTAPFNDTPTRSDSSATEQPEIPEPKPTPSPAQTSFNKALYSTSDANSLWVVVNKQHPLRPASYAPSDLTGIGNGQLSRAATATALGGLLNAATTAGHPLAVLSGYRSYATQSALYNNYVRTDGQANADTYSARPGHSEHQTGLAIDLGNGTCDLLTCFGDTAAGTWLAANAHKHGFVVRYPAGKTAITGYQYEPWHLRYVGSELATEMNRKNIATLEEFFGITGGTSY